MPFLQRSASQRKALERTYRRRVPPSKVLSAELARHLAQISNDLRRQVGVFVSRDGAIRNVIVGDAAQLMLPDIGRLRGRAGRFRGLRLVHTHLKGEPLTADDLNDLALLRLDMVIMVEVTMFMGVMVSRNIMAGRVRRYRAILSAASRRIL